MVTPFRENGKPDFTALEQQTDFQLENGTDALLVLGTTGESATLSDKEKKQIIRTVIRRVDHRIPVLVGAGSNNTEKAYKLAQMAADEGADAHLQVTPYYNKTTQSGLLAHYTYLADRVDLPMILYNVPARTGVNIRPETYAELSRHKNIVAVKEANGNVASVLETLRLCEDGFSVYSGDDALITPFLSVGAQGVISVLSNIMPETVHEICALYAGGRVKESAAKQIAVSDLISALFCETNPIPIKTAMALLRRDSGKVRLPLVAMTNAGKEHLRLALIRHGMLAFS